LCGKRISVPDNRPVVVTNWRQLIFRNRSSPPLTTNQQRAMLSHDQMFSVNREVHRAQ
jgi:hypothetical protein